MKLIISPYLSVGPIRLGMTRDEICAALSSKPKELMYDPMGIKKADRFADWNLHVYYRDDYVCTAVDVFGEGGNSAVFKDRDLLATKYPVLLDDFKKLDPDIEVDNSSFISRKFGISVHAPNPSKTPHGVLVFERGYWD